MLLYNSLHFIVSVSENNHYFLELFFSSISDILTDSVASNVAAFFSPLQALPSFVHFLCHSLPSFFILHQRNFCSIISVNKQAVIFQFSMALGIFPSILLYIHVSYVFPFHINFIPLVFNEDIAIVMAISNHCGSLSNVI